MKLISNLFVWKTFYCALLVPVCSVPCLQSLPEDVIMKMSDLLEEVQIKYLKSEAQRCVTVIPSSNRMKPIDYVYRQR